MNVTFGLESSASLNEILPALLGAQAQISPAQKSAKNPHFQSRYADLSDVLDVCRSPLSTHDIVVLNPIRPVDDGRIEIACVLLHVSGQWIKSRIVMNCSAARPQEVGSALTYYRRYLLAALLSVATEDDDGAAAARPVPATPAGVTPRGVGRDERRAPAPAAPTPPRETWAAWSARECTRVNDAWRAAMAMENVSPEGRKDFQALVNPHQLTNKVCSHAIEKGLIDAAAVEKPGADGKPVRDRAKAAQAVADLFPQRPKGVRAFVENYVREKEHEARVALGMTLPEGEESVQATAVGKADGPREPGEEG